MQRFPNTEIAQITEMPDQGRQSVHAAGSALWWAEGLAEELQTRRPLIDLYEDYWAGRHKLNFASSKYRESFGEMLSAVSDNWIPLIIGASVERMRVQGFRFGGDSKGDSDAWDIWQENGLDADSSMAFTESCKHGESYLLVEPEAESGTFGRHFARRSRTRIRITVEHPSQMIVARAPGDHRRNQAAFKMWEDPAAGYIFGTLWTPTGIHRFFQTDKGEWRPRGERGEREMKNPTGVCPVVPIVNDPHILGCRPPLALTMAPHKAPDVPIGLGRSDMADAVSTVDQINKLICDMLVASEVAAYRQRWVTGLEIPVDESGNEVEPFDSAVDRLWVVEPDEDGEVNAKFGEFGATDLANYSKPVESRVQSLAARTRTPPHYLLGQVVNVSGDALKAAETGLSSKVNGKTRYTGEALEWAMRIAFAWRGDKRSQDWNAETVWAPTESRSESEYVDSLVKKMALGVPKEQLWIDAGYSPQQITRFKQMLIEEQLQAELFGADVEDEGVPEMLEV